MTPVDTTALAWTQTILHCDASGDPPPVISWRKNEELINSSESARVQVHENGSLSINPVLLEDMGYYQCVAENDQGMVESDVAMLMVDGKQTLSRRLRWFSLCA